MTNGFLPRVFALLATVSFFLVACDHSRRYSALPSGTSVLAFGDSVTYGTGAAKDEDYPSKLAAISGWKIHNLGVPGDTSDGAKARLASAMDETQPKLVIVEIGGNDFLRRIPEAQVKENIRNILRMVKQAGVPVVLVSVPSFSIMGAAVGSLSDAELYEQLAKEEEVPLVPKVFAGILSDSSLKSDQIHPNAAGYRLMANSIAASLRKTGLLVEP